MRLLEDLAFFLGGLAIALITVSAGRIGSGAWSLVQFPVVFIVLAVFYLKEGRLASVAAGLGIGLDAVSAYPFLAWVFVIGGTTAVGWWLSKAVLTNRSLPSLLLLTAAMRVAYFIIEIVVSRLGQVFGGTVWYMVTGVNAGRALSALGIELLLLIAFFAAHVRLRGERARMLTHL